MSNPEFTRLRGCLAVIGLLLVDTVPAVDFGRASSGMVWFRCVATLFGDDDRRDNAPTNQRHQARNHLGQRIALRFLYDDIQLIESYPTTTNTLKKCH
jgi:hypothetical protein